MTLQGVGSQKSQISAAMIEGLRDNWLNFPTILDGNYWSPKNTDEQNATAKYPRLTRTNRDANFCMSDYWLYNGRYIRLKKSLCRLYAPQSMDYEGVYEYSPSLCKRK